MLVTFDEINSNPFGKSVSLTIDDASLSSATESFTETKLMLKLFGILPIRTINISVIGDREVFAGGKLLGFDLLSSGVVIVNVSNVLTEDGEKFPLKDAGAQEGDILLSIEGKNISTQQEIEDILSELNEEDVLDCTVLRGEKSLNLKVIPALDILTNKYKLGVFVQNSSSGIGTLSFVDEEGRFGAVGHSLLPDSDPRKNNIQSGDVFDSDILSVTKGSANNPGELKAVIDRAEGKLGEIDKSCNYGVYGSYNVDLLEQTKKYSLGGRLSVRPGKAKILAEVDDNGVQEYEIEIIKTNKQKKQDSKSIVLRMTDKRLLNLTGGIVQGMSGSPIIQDNKLVGSLTHVFTSDATKGYGVYMDWMIDK